MNSPITLAEIQESRQEAEDKLERIIEREGDADGARREDWYFIEILKEVILTKREATQLKHFRNNSAIGRDALEFIDTLLTPEEIAESNLRVALTDINKEGIKPLPDAL